MQIYGERKETPVTNKKNHIETIHIPREQLPDDPFSLVTHPPAMDEQPVKLGYPGPHTAFRAGWNAAMRMVDHEWGPAPPQTAEAAWDKWLTNRRNPHIQHWKEEDR